jgi:hypothetical protein
VKFVIDEQNQRFSKKHIDLAILDLIISRALTEHRGDIQSWHIHRRYGQHEFIFEAFCSSNTGGQNIQNAIVDHQFAGDLLSNGVATSVAPTSWGHNVTDICDQAWPSEFRELWPEFAQHQSEMQLKLTQTHRRNQQNAPTIQVVQALPFAEILVLYEGIQKHIDGLWLRMGSHAFVHHMHSFFAYQPFVSHVTTQQLVIDIR